MTKSLLSHSFRKISVESTVIQTKENKTKDVFLRNHSSDNRVFAVVVSKNEKRRILSFFVLLNKNENEVFAVVTFRVMKNEE
jgi:hypothetical protein